MQKEVRPLYIWPKNADLTELKSVVVDMGLPFKVAPYWFEPGEHDRCIALSEGFDHLTDHVYPKSESALKASVEWFFGLRELPQVKTTLSKLQSVFGEDVKEEWDWPPSE